MCYIRNVPANAAGNSDLNDDYMYFDNVSGQQDKRWPWAVFLSCPRWPDSTLDCGNLRSPGQCAVGECVIGDGIVAPAIAGDNADAGSEAAAAVAAAAAADATTAVAVAVADNDLEHEAKWLLDAAEELHCWPSTCHT